MWKTNYKFHCIIPKNLEKWRKYIRWIEYYLKYNINKNAIPFFFLFKYSTQSEDNLQPYNEGINILLLDESMHCFTYRKKINRNEMPCHAYAKFGAI